MKIFHLNASGFIVIKYIIDVVVGPVVDSDKWFVNIMMREQQSIKTTYANEEDARAKYNELVSLVYLCHE